MIKAFLLAAAVAILPLLPASAAEVHPAQAIRQDFTSGASVLVYYTPAADGFHVVATVQSDDTDRQSIVRLVSTLAPGQSTQVSVPGRAGGPADVVEIARVGDALRVGRPASQAVRW